jgi:hypothetical protein
MSIELKLRNSLKPMKKFILFMTTLTAWLSMAQSVHAEDFKKPLHFATGKNSAMVTGDIVRGDADIYLLKVHSGQLMSISVSSLEENAAFDVLEPKDRNSKAEKSITGGSDITKWSGSLAKTGLYKIVVSGTRGNTSYKLKVSVK